MRRTVTTLAAATFLLAIAGSAVAQPPRPGGDRPGGDRPGGNRGGFTIAIIKVLDKNEDGTLDETELKVEAVTAALKGLDANKDGKLTREEYFGSFGRPGGERPTGGSFVERLMESDKNKDGKLAEDEVSERMQPLFKQADANGDGFLDKAEIEKIAERFNRGRPGAGGPGGRPQGGRPEGGRPEGGRPRPEGDGAPARPARPVID